MSIPARPYNFHRLKSFCKGHIMDMLVYLFFCAWACCDCYLLLYLFFAICVSDSFGDVTVFFAISGIVVLFKVVEKIMGFVGGGCQFSPSTNISITWHRCDRPQARQPESRQTRPSRKSKQTIFETLGTTLKMIYTADPTTNNQLNKQIGPARAC